MKKSKLVAITLAMFSYAVSSYGCLGGVVRLNDDTLLQGQGVYAKNDKGEWSLQIDSRKNVDQLGKNLDAKDSTGKVTHTFIILGYKADAKGIFSTTYLVRWPNGGEQLMLIKTNYAGNGVSSRAIGPANAPPPELKKSDDFDSLKVSGCD